MKETASGETDAGKILQRHSFQPRSDEGRIETAFQPKQAASYKTQQLSLAQEKSLLLLPGALPLEESSAAYVNT